MNTRLAVVRTAVMPSAVELPPWTALTTSAPTDDLNDGAIDIYEEIYPDHYRSLGTTQIGSPAKSGLLVPELNRYFVAVPQHSDVDAAVLEYKVQ